MSAPSPFSKTSSTAVAEGLTLQRAQAEAQLGELSARFGFALDPHQPIDNLA